LAVAEPDASFWEQMRAMEAAGAAIGLHGYGHLCLSHGRSLAPLHRRTEFAGAPYEMQREWIRAGLKILRGQGLTPRIWVAPRHGLDGTTLRALREEGIGLVSEGLARLPFLRGGLTWIPQQLWAPVEKAEGLWTICLHSNTASDALVEQLRVFLERHGAQFTFVERVLAEYAPAELEMSEQLVETWTLWRIQSSRLRKRLIRPPRKLLKG
jgi:predicted deacetylase